MRGNTLLRRTGVHRYVRMYCHKEETLNGNRIRYGREL